MVSDGGNLSFKVSISGTNTILFILSYYCKVSVLSDCDSVHDYGPSVCVGGF